MANLLVLLGVLVDSIALLLFLAAFYYVMRVRLFTSGFKEVWNYVYFGIICIILITLSNLFFITRGENIDTNLQNFLTSALLLLASFFFSYGFYRLSEIFNEISHKKIFPRKTKKD